MSIKWYAITCFLHPFSSYEFVYQYLTPSMSDKCSVGLTGTKGHCS